MPQIPVVEIDDSRLVCYRNVAQCNLTRHSGLFIAEGEKLVERLVGSRFDVDSLLAEPEYAERLEMMVPVATPIYVASRAMMTEIAGFQFHRGVLACGRRTARQSIAELLADSDASRVTIVVLPDVQDPTNLGSIIRSAAAFGCAGVVLGPKCADAFSRRVLRVSMGAAFHLPIVESTDLRVDLKVLAEARFELAAAVIDPAAESLASAGRRERLAILFGSEGHGLTEEWLHLCQRRVTIPMQLGIDSLNVAVAAAVLLYHFADKRGDLSL